MKQFIKDAVNNAVKEFIIILPFSIIWAVLFSPAGVFHLSLHYYIATVLIMVVIYCVVVEKYKVKFKTRFNIWK